MEEIVPRLRRPDKRRLHRKVQKCRDARLRTRYLIILNLSDGISASETARRLHVSRTTVYRVARRFREPGEAGLVDRREENGQKKLDEDSLGLLYALVESSPWEYGGRRLTWTWEMLVETIFQKTGIRI